MKLCNLVRGIFVALAIGFATSACSLAPQDQPTVEPPVFRSPLQPPPQSPRPVTDLSPIGTPVQALPTRTPRPTETPRGWTEPPPPPGYPTGMPWPPPTAIPLPTATSQPFPTPVFRPAPAGKRPDQIPSLWFPYFPYIGAAPQLREVLIDQQGQRWGQTDRRLDLVLSAPERGPDPGPILIGLYPSPNYRWLAADISYLSSQLIEISTGKSRYLVSGALDFWHFMAWHPDGQRILVAYNDEHLLVDLVSGKYEAIDLKLPKSEFDIPYLRDVSYSPDGMYLADIMVYPAVYKGRNIGMTEVGVRDDNGTRKPIAQILGGTYVTEHSLTWSPDGQKLAWIVNVVPDGTTTPLKLTDVQSQLWIAEPSKGSARMMGILGKSVQYPHCAVWSPDGRYIAALKVEPGAVSGKEAFTNIYLIDPATGDQSQLTYHQDWRLSHLTWSPDGRRLAFMVSKGEYGEIWVTNLDGTQQYPVAGPVGPAFFGTPFVWMP